MPAQRIVPWDPTITHEPEELRGEPFGPPSSALGIFRVEPAASVTPATNLHAEPGASVTQATEELRADGREGSLLAPDGEEQVRAWMTHIRNDGRFFDQRANWIEMAHALYGASGGSAWGREIWLDWCLRWGGGDPVEEHRVWDTLKLKSVRAGWRHLKALSWAGDPEGAAAALYADACRGFDPIDDDAARAVEERAARLGP